MRPIQEQGKFLSDWKYVEVARYVPSLSRVIRDKDGDLPLILDYADVEAYANKHNNIGIYTSVWLFNSKDIETAIRYSNLYFDLDSKDINDSHKETITLYDYLSKFIPEEGIKIYFTGKKGFHLECVATCLGISPSNELPTVYRFIASDIKTKLKLESVDLSVYDARRMWRLPGSRHQDSGLYKIPLTKEELYSTMEIIHSIAKSSRSKEYEDISFSYKANQWYRDMHYSMEKDKERSKDYLSYFNKHGSSAIKNIDSKPKQFTPKVLLDKCPAILRMLEEAKKNKDLDHESRLFLCSILTYTDESIEFLHKILSLCSDYNVEKSTAHIQDWIKRREMGIGGRPYTCDRANSVGVGCGSCNLEERRKWVKIGDRYVETNDKSSPSPIRFAYKTISKR
jgi:hypothetical protein